jgi:hypothetical protein
MFFVTLRRFRGVPKEFSMALGRVIDAAELAFDVWMSWR